MGRVAFKLPDVGEGIAEAELVAWKVELGQAVEEDDPVAEVMTDKATVEITAPVSGVVVERNGEVGAMAAIGSVLVVFETDAEAAPAPQTVAPQTITPQAAANKAEASAPKVPVKPNGAGAPTAQPVLPAPAALETQPRTVGERPLAAPAVRARAEELGVKLQYVPGTGPAGRITHEDLDRFVAEGGLLRGPASAARPGGGYVQREGKEDIKVIGLRRKIAEKMQESKRRIPHYAYVEEVDMTELEALRVHLNGLYAKSRPKLTVLPFFVRALAVLLPQYPQINATFDDDAGVLTRHAAFHAGIATQTPNGLMVAVLRHAEAMDLWTCASEISRLAEAARSGKAAREELTGSTLTITSLGPLGGVATTPVINYPEVAIIGPNKIIERPVVLNGQIAVRKMMNLSSSFDHRVVDGYDAAEFIQRLKAMLERPAMLFLDA